MTLDSPGPRATIEAFERVEQSGVVDHVEGLRVCTISKLSDEGQDIIGSIFLDPFSGTLAFKQSMR